MFLSSFLLVCNCYAWIGKRKCACVHVKCDCVWGVYRRVGGVGKKKEREKRAESRWKKKKEKKKIIKFQRWCFDFYPLVPFASVHSGRTFLLFLCRRLFCSSRLVGVPLAFVSTYCSISSGCNVCGWVGKAPVSCAHQIERKCKQTKKVFDIIWKWKY